MKIVLALIVGLLISNVGYASIIVSDSLQTDFMKCYTVSDGHGHNENVCVQNSN